MSTLIMVTTESEFMIHESKVKVKVKYRLVLEQCQSFKPPPKVRFHSSEEELEEL